MINKLPSSSTSISADSPTLKKEQFIQIQTSFIYRNLIKKLKTHCIKLYEKKLHSTLKNPHKFTLYNLSSKKSRLLFRFFKSDISKHKNKILLETSMKVLLKNFIGDNSLNELICNSNKKHLFFQLMNMKWKYFLVFMKYNIENFTCGDIKDDFINKENLSILFDYIYNGNTNYTYKHKKSCNKQYFHFVKELENKECCNTKQNNFNDNDVEQLKEFNKFIQDFHNFE